MPSTQLPDMITDEYLTLQANEIDPIELRLTGKRLVDFQGIRSTNIAVIQVDNSIQILSAKSLDERGDLLNKKGVKIFRFEAQYYPHEHNIVPRDVQNLKPLPGTNQTEVEAVNEVLIDAISQMDKNYAVLMEWLMMNMIKGNIINPDGTVLVDLYQLFGKTKKTLNFELADANTNVLLKCAELIRMIEDGLQGDTIQGVEVQVSNEFYDALTSHPKVEKAFDRWNESEKLRKGFGSVFEYGQVRFERLHNKVGNLRFIEADKGHAYPLGTLDTFQGTYSPADMIPYVNTLGQRLYISTKDLDHNKGIEIHMESRPVVVCKRLDALVELTAS